MFLMLLLLGGWAAYGRGPVILAAIRTKALPQVVPVPVKSRTAVSWANDGKPLEPGQARRVK
jgi:hypothetical protein